ncbi:MAG: hypothetical protein ABL919_00005 [Methylococcales bacterium]|nr:hypothetical protein [Methylococcaceae bacterium]
MYTNIIHTTLRFAFNGLSSLILIFGLSFGSALATEADSKIDWTLGVLSVKNPGIKSTLAEGTLVTNYVLETTASSDDPFFIPQGKFQLTLSIFSPTVDLGVQKKGFWYVTGKWELLDNGAESRTTGRNKPGRLSGTVNTELTFNPVTNLTHPWDAVTQVPFSTFIAVGEKGNGQKLHGDGSLSLGASPAGNLSLQIKLLPKIN